MADEHPLHNLPIEVIEGINRVVRVSREMLRDTGREPTPEEIAARLGRPVEEVREYLRIAKKPF